MTTVRSVKDICGFPSYATQSNCRPLQLATIVVFHLLALAAPFFFTLAGLFVFIGLVFLSGMFGLVIGYHRLLAHRTFQTPKPMEHLLSLLGCLALETGPLTWVAVHRYHHQHSDTDIDPHTPRYSILWSHMVWAGFEHPSLREPTLRERLTRDIRSDGFHRFLEHHIYLLNAVSGALLFLAGYLLGGLDLGLSILFWGFFLRIVIVWHQTFLISSACHRWGYRNYATRDDSRNLRWVAFLAFGEGWHNNHHAAPRRANFGHRQGEFDLSHRTLRLLQLVGLVRSIR